MLERSHAQLTAGLRELFRRTHNSDGWTGPRLELENHNRPLTHQILEALGVLQTEDWEEPESVDDNGQGFERYGLDSDGWMFSESASSPAQVTFSPGSATQTAFPHSEIISKRRSKLQPDLPLATQTLTMPPPVMTTSASMKAEPYNQACPNLIPAPLDMFTSKEGMVAGLDRTTDSMMDWTFGMDDMFGPLGGQEHSIQGR